MSEEDRLKAEIDELETAVEALRKVLGAVASRSNVSRGRVDEALVVAQTAIRLRKARECER